MGKLKAFFSRSSKDEKADKSLEDTKGIAQPNISQGSDVDIASLPAAGMQRSSQAPYVLSHVANGASPSITNASTSSDATASSLTAVNKNFVSKNGESHWQGKPKGKAYDKREELSAEDEEMWAKMSM